MIKRKYFFAVQVAHNNNTGQYSWWHGTVTQKSFFVATEELILRIRSDAAFMLHEQVPTNFTQDDVELIAFNRI